MSYINFKEEIYKCNIQLEKRKSNNSKLVNSYTANKFISNKYNADKDFSFKLISNILIGENTMRYENNFIEYKDLDILCCTFESCKFYNVRFTNCNFIGCTFINCEFGDGGSIFESCCFLKSESELLPALNINENLSCTFSNCKFYIKFLNCNLGYSIFEDSKFTTCNFSYCDFTNLIIINCELNRLVITDCDLSHLKVVNSYMTDFEFRDKSKSKIDEKTFFDKFTLRYNNRDEYEGIYNCYQNIADKFQENNLPSNFGEYYYLGKCTERKTLDIIPKIGSYIAWLTCGYGERPLFSVYSSLVFILLFSVLYLITGFEIEDKITNLSTLINNFTFSNLLTAINEALNLSTGMFTCVGFNNSKPIALNYFISNIEMLVGVVMMGLGISVLTKKSVR